MATLLQRLHEGVADRWRGPGGYREVMIVAGPLILTTGAFSIQHFVDRMFLSWHSNEAVAAAMAAGMLYFTVFALVMGTVRYVSTFVAQYFGSGQDQRIGPVLWQSIYVGILGGLALLLLMPFAGWIFHVIGHDPAVRDNETIYFRILLVGALPALIAASMDSFYTGLGKTWPLMWISVATTIVNLSLDYLLIFGKFGFPAMGIAGAAWATVIAQTFPMVAFTWLLARRHYDERFHLWRGWRPNPKLCWRLLRFGLPSGLQFFVDIIGFSIFILLIGRLGTNELTASTIAFNINTLAFMPMFGTGIAVSVLVGQQLGANRPDLAERGVYSGFHITVLYMTVIAASYVLVPQLYLAPFAAKADPSTFPAIARLTTLLLWFVAIYSLFDGCNIIFISAIKGAGDTRFVLITMTIMSSLGLVAPCLAAIYLFRGGIFSIWAIATVYICALGGIFYLRFRGGRWQSMRVTEDT